MDELPENELCHVTSLIVLVINSQSFECFLTQMSNFFIESSFGWICNFLLGIIIVISIFGGIKENYRWFILHQAIWDLLITYNFICNNPRLNWYSISLTRISEFREVSSCKLYIMSDMYDNFFEFNIILMVLFREWVINSPYLALFLLSFTRFLALFFMNFYDKLTKKWRIFWLLLLFNLIFMFTIGGYKIFEEAQYLKEKELFNACEKVYQKCYEKCDKTFKKLPKLENCYKTCDSTNFACNEPTSEIQLFIILKKIFLVFHYFRNPILLLFSLFSTICIISKIAKQANFQKKHNRNDFFASVRIAAVLGFQTFITFLLLIIEISQYIDEILSTYFSITFMGPDESSEIGGGYTILNFHWPKWLNGGNGLTTHLQTIRQIRIFLEALIVLGIMTGYREAISNVVKIGFKFIKNPKISFREHSMSKIIPFVAWSSNNR